MACKNFFKLNFPFREFPPLPHKFSNGPSLNWRCYQKEQTAFDGLKEKLSNPPVLTHRSVELAFKIDTDASNDGVGAVISHICPKGEERPIHSFFFCYKNIFYKNIEAEIRRNFKNILRIKPRLRF